MDLLDNAYYSPICGCGKMLLLFILTKNNWIEENQFHYYSLLLEERIKISMSTCLERSIQKKKMQKEIESEFFKIILWIKIHLFTFKTDNMRDWRKWELTISFLLWIIDINMVKLHIYIQIYLFVNWFNYKHIAQIRCIFVRQFPLRFPKSKNDKRRLWRQTKVQYQFIIITWINRFNKM